MSGDDPPHGDGQADRGADRSDRRTSDDAEDGMPIAGTDQGVDQGTGPTGARGPNSDSDGDGESDGDGGQGRDGEQDRDRDRRRLLKLVGLGLVGLGLGGAYATRRASRPDVTDPGDGDDGDEESDADADVAGDDEDAGVPPLVERYAPDVNFGRLERWYPTDPRRYASTADGRTVVDGFDALRSYTREFRSSGDPPAPTAFYHVAEAADDVLALQYYFYSVFDQFTVNFHWHDWELLQVFVDAEDGEPLLLSASAHSRITPNNEFLGPDLADGRRPTILAEVGSHSSATDANPNTPSFERFPSQSWEADVTNDLTAIVESVESPFAYGLPRDEGARLPYVMPTLDDRPLDEHPDLLDVERADFVDESVTVDDWTGLAGPPTDLPTREPGRTFVHPSSPTASAAGEGGGDGSTAVHTYELAPMDDLVGHLDDFTGPQLSFPFAVPGFAEELYAEHITTVGIPWEGARYDDPVADITGTAHRRAIDGQVPAGLGRRVVGRVRLLAAGAEGALPGVTGAALEAAREVATISLHAPPVELAVRLASEHPAAAVTNGGQFGFLNVEPGEHTLVVNGPGVAPVGLAFDHDGDGTVRVGADGELAAVPNGATTLLRGDGRESGGVERVVVTEDYAGPIFAGRPVEDDRFAVPVHRAGRYLVEVVDGAGRRGVRRVVPGDREEYTLESLSVDRANGARSLAAYLEETVDLAIELAQGSTAGADGRREAGGVTVEYLSSARRDAERAAETGDDDGADALLERAAAAVEEAIAALEADDRDGYDPSAATLLLDRCQRALELAVLAREAGT